MNNEMILVLKSIAKELHDMNKKLDRIGQASIFNEKSEVQIEYKVIGTYSYEEETTE